MLPETKPVRPMTETVADESTAIAATETWVVPVATVMVEPSVNVCPLTVRVASLLLLESEATRTVMT